MPRANTAAIDELKARAALAGLCARFYLKEADESFLARLNEVAGDEAGEDGWGLIGRALKAPVPPPVASLSDELAADYARVFLGAGVVDQPTAFPFESVYTSPTRLVGQDAAEAMYRLYATEGLKPETADLFPDHLGLQLNFVVYLLNKAIKALTAGGQAEEELRAVADFEKKHIFNWVPAFLVDIRRCARTDFYRGAALLTEEFLREEKALQAP